MRLTTLMRLASTPSRRLRPPRMLVSSSSSCNMRISDTRPSTEKMRAKRKRFERLGICDNEIDSDDGDRNTLGYDVKIR
jgi:hypothetical protein